VEVYVNGQVMVNVELEVKCFEESVLTCFMVYYTGIYLCTMRKLD
jgi:hypothetical protein